MQHADFRVTEDQTTIVVHGIADFYAGSSGLATVRVLRSYADRQGAIYDVIAELGASPPMHFHKYDERFEVIDSSMTFCLDGKVIEASTGTGVIVPAGTYHSWINQSDKPTIMRVRVPADATFLAMLHDPVARGRDEFCTVAAESGALVVGPPLLT